MKPTVLLATIALLAAPATAAAGPPQIRIDEPRPVLDGTSPFANACGVPQDGFQYSPNTETDARMAVDPTNPNRIVVAFQQDPQLAISIARSQSGGRTWRRVDPVGLSACNGTDEDQIADSDVAFGPDGRAYLVVTTGYVTPPGIPFQRGLSVFSSRIQLLHSDDAGRSWSMPADLTGLGQYQHQAVVRADPRNARRVYVAWTTGANPAGHATAFQDNTVYLRVSNDRGRTFGPAKVVSTPGPFPGINGFTITKRGTLVMSQTTGASVLTQRSRDGGRTWSEPLLAGTRAGVLTDGLAIRGVSGDALASGPDGSVWLVRTDGTRAVLQRSTDDGASWDAGRVLAETPNGVFLPQVAVRDDGAVGVLWYDARRDVAGDGRATTDVWVAVSSDGEGSWTTRHLAGPFDYAQASRPLFDLPFVGDYQALDATPRGFVAAFSVAPPLARTGKADLWSARIDVTRRGRRPAP